MGNDLEKQKDKKRTKRKRKKRRNISEIRPMDDVEYNDLFGNIDEPLLFGAITSKPTVSKTKNEDSKNSEKLNAIQTKDAYDELFDVDNILIDHINVSAMELMDDGSVSMELSEGSDDQKENIKSPLQQMMENDAEYTFDTNENDEDEKDETESAQIAKPLLDMALRNKIAKAMRIDRKQKQKQRRSRYGRMMRMGSISENEVSDFESLDVSPDVSPFSSPFSSKASSPNPPSPEIDELPKKKDKNKKRKKKKKSKKKHHNEQQTVDMHIDQEFVYQPQSDDDDQEIELHQVQN